MSIREIIYRFLESIGENSHHSQHVTSCISQRLHGLQTGPPGRDQILHHDHFLTFFIFTFNQIFQPMILGSRTHVHERQPQFLCNQSSLGNSTGCHPGDQFHLWVFCFNQIHELVPNIRTYFRVRQRLPVITINGRFPPGSPCKRVIRF